MLFPSLHPALGSRRKAAPAPTFPPPRRLLVSFPKQRQESIACGACVGCDAKRTRKSEIVLRTRKG